MTRGMINPIFLLCCVCLSLFAFGSVVSASEVKMADVQSLAKLPVNEILQDSPVTEIGRGDYWKNIEGSDKPVIVMFYINEDQHSKNLATLYRYVALEFSDQIEFYSFMVNRKGKLEPSVIQHMKETYSLDEAPGVLVYDKESGERDGAKNETPAFKLYKTPSMLLWKLYYSQVGQTIRKRFTSNPQGNDVGDG